MTVKKTFSRTTALIAGTAMLLINGVIYAWSIYSMPFGAGFGWSSAQLGACFTVMLASFCLGGVFGGAVANRRGVRVSYPSEAYSAASASCSACSCRRTSSGCCSSPSPSPA